MSDRWRLALSLVQIVGAIFCLALTIMVIEQYVALHQFIHSH